MFTIAYVSCVTCLLSRVTCHVSHVACHMSHFIFIFENEVKLVGGGSVINGATLSSFSNTVAAKYTIYHKHYILSMSSSFHSSGFIKGGIFPLRGQLLTTLTNCDVGHLFVTLWCLLSLVFVVCVEGQFWQAVYWVTPLYPGNWGLYQLPLEVLSNSPVGTEVCISSSPQYSIKEPHSKTTFSSWWLLVSWCCMTSPYVL